MPKYKYTPAQKFTVWIGLDTPFYIHLDGTVEYDPHWSDLNTVLTKFWTLLVPSFGEGMINLKYEGELIVTIQARPNRVIRGPQFLTQDPESLRFWDKMEQIGKRLK